MRLDKIAEALRGTVHGDPSLNVCRTVHPAEAESETDLALAMENNLVSLLVECPSRAAILNEGMERLKALWADISRLVGPDTQWLGSPVFLKTGTCT